MSYKTHVFICTNSPDKQGKCGHKGSEELRKQLKEKCTELYGKDLRVNSSGCLGYCEKGIAAVIYPQGKWLTHLTKDSLQPLLQEISDCHSAHVEKNK